MKCFLASVFVSLVVVAAMFVEWVSIVAVFGQEKATDGLAIPKGIHTKYGVTINSPKAFQGYTLVAPFTSKKSQLINMQGEIVRTWNAAGNPASCAYLLENGGLLRPCSLGLEAESFRGLSAVGGRIQEFNSSGERVWDFKFHNDKRIPHHDIVRMPNGNILMIVWDQKTSLEAIDAGRRPSSVGARLLSDSLIEIKPSGKTAGTIVWEWHLWDHLVQDYDKQKANYAKVGEHPELVDINFGEDVTGAYAAKRGGADKLRSIGYIASNAKKTGGPNADWTHFNGIDYNADLDQVLISVHNFSEFWVIDHSTTTAQAASHKGGKAGKGGDLLYRWGNPRAYGGGAKKDQMLFAQHNAHWIPKGLPGAGNILVFNNGTGRPEGAYSSVDEIAPPVDGQGQHTFMSGTPFGPERPSWSYCAPDKGGFYSSFISGAQRLPNGNTLICSGVNGVLFEVTPEKEIVWKYVNPGGPGRPGQVVPIHIQDMLELNNAQRKELEVLQANVTDKLTVILKMEQNKQMHEAKPGFGPDGFGSPPRTGEIISLFFQSRLKCDADQKKQLRELQMETDGKLATIFTQAQMKKTKDPSDGVASAGSAWGASIFRAYRYAPSHPGIAGKDMTPSKSSE
jgi:hypothetical protein